MGQADPPSILTLVGRRPLISSKRILKLKTETNTFAMRNRRNRRKGRNIHINRAVDTAYILSHASMHVVPRHGGHN